MKKNEPFRELFYRSLKKTLLTMRIAGILLILGILQARADDAYSQKTRLSLNFSETEVVKILDKIEDESEFFFLYNEKLLDTERKVSISENDQLISVILDDLFAGTDVKHTIIDRKIILAPEYLTEASNTQQKRISGTVTDKNGPIPGANVVITGTTFGTITDMNGKYGLDIPQGSKSLTFSFVGMENQVIAIGTSNQIDVMLTESAIGLDEVVVVGYGTQKKMSVTGAVATVQNVQLRVMPDANLGSRLQGRVSGVTITNDASPGGVPQVRVRGYGSINNNDPLYVVDGIPIIGNLDAIDPNNIQSISVLKDASSSAIYGSRASNGVVIITTKHGTSGAPQATFQMRYGIQNWKDNIKVLNPQQAADLQWLAFRNDGYKPGDVAWGNTMYGYGETPVLPDYILPAGGKEGQVDESLYKWPSPYFGIVKANKTGTDWFKEIRNPNAPTQEYNLSLTGGTDRSNYAFSVGRLDQKGSVDYTYYKRNSLSLNAEMKMTDWLKFGENLSAVHSNRVGFTNENDLNPIAMAERTSTISPVYDIHGNFCTGWQPVALLYRAKDNTTKRLRTLGNIYGQIDLFKHLSIKSLLGVEYNAIRATNYALRMFESQDVAAADKLTESFNGNLQYNWANTLNFNFSVNNSHNINILVGSESVDFRSDYLTGSRSTYPFTDLNYMILDSGEKDQASSGGFDQWYTFSYFSRLNYDYKGKYLLEAVIRRDGSSRFIGSNRWATFPAVSVGWRISDESFMKDNVAWINTLKLRAGYGQNGNDNVGNYNAYSTFRSNGYESYYNIAGTSTNQSAAGFHQYRLGNPDAKWEASATTDAGFDATLFNNKFEVSFDLYKRVTTDMLYPDPKPGTWGMLQFPSRNIGEISNKGYDITLTYNGKVGNDFKYNVHVIGSHYVNKVITLNGNPKEILYGPQLRTEVFTATWAGIPMSSFYGYIVEGIFNTPEDIANHAPFKAAATGTDSYTKLGKLMYKDVNNDGLVNTGDLTVTGNPHPKLSYGLNLDMQYKDFDMSIFTKGVYGVDVLNFRKWGLFSGISTTEDLYNSWTQERYDAGEKITRPIITRDNVELHRPSSFFVEDGSYFRVSSVVVGYSMPSQIISKLQIKGLRFYVQVTNPITITKYTGLDPELPNTDLLLGVDNSNYPIQKSWIFGIDLNF
jgi:TonB-dependent starch-binding outer membrane protein SusC